MSSAAPSGTIGSLLVPSWAPRLHPMRYEPPPGESATAEVPTPRRPPLAEHPLPAVRPAFATAGATEIADILRIALEVLDGRRPHSHLSGLFGPRAQRYWRAAAGQQRRSTTPRRLQRVLIGTPRSGVAEVAAVIVDDDRCRALPARFERTAARQWRCTDVRLL